MKMANPSAKALQRRIDQYKADIAGLEQEVAELRAELATAEAAEWDRGTAQECFRALVARIGNPTVRQLPIDLRLLVEELSNRLDMPVPQ